MQTNPERGFTELESLEFLLLGKGGAKKRQHAVPRDVTEGRKLERVMSTM
jgi:hypothetical protein